MCLILIENDITFLSSFFFSLLFLSIVFFAKIIKKRVNNGFLSRALLIAKKLKAKQGRMAESSVDKLAEKV